MKANLNILTLLLIFSTLSLISSPSQMTSPLRALTKNLSADRHTSIPWDGRGTSG